jgi:hypothetical protein
MSPGAQGFLSALQGWDFLYAKTLWPATGGVWNEVRHALCVTFTLLLVPITEDPGIHVTRTGGPCARLPVEYDGPSQIQRLQQRRSPH